MKHFTVDTRRITKYQFEALKGAAEKAGLDVGVWEWKNRGTWPLIATRSSTIFSEPSMSKGDFGSLDELVTYTEAIRRLAGASVRTPAQEAGFEVGSLGVLTAGQRALGAGVIVRLVVDDATTMPKWAVVDGDRESGSEANGCLSLNLIRKLHNVVEK